MTISNPLADNSPDHEDQSLVLRARSGDRQAVSIYPRETNRPWRRWVDRWMPNLIHVNILDSQ
jgi:hypothetical protein